MWKAWSSAIGPARNSRAGPTAKAKSDGPLCCIGRTAPSGKYVRDTSSWRPEQAEFRTFLTSRCCATSAAKSCTPANTVTARHGRANTCLSLAPATAATILRRTSTRAGQRSRSCNAVRPHRQYRAERATSLRVVLRRTAFGGLRPHHYLHTAYLGKEGPQAPDRASEASRQGASRWAGARGVQA